MQFMILRYQQKNPIDGISNLGDEVVILSDSSIDSITLSSIASATTGDISC